MKSIVDFLKSGKPYKRRLITNPLSMSQVFLERMQLDILSKTYYTKQFTITTSPVLVFKANDKDYLIMISQPLLTGEGAGNIYWGKGSQIASSTGYGLAPGFPQRFFVERDVEIWAVSNDTATLHMIISY